MIKIVNNNIDIKYELYESFLYHLSRPSMKMLEIDFGIMLIFVEWLKNYSNKMKLEYFTYWLDKILQPNNEFIMHQFINIYFNTKRIIITIYRT